MELLLLSELRTMLRIILTLSMCLLLACVATVVDVVSGFRIKGKVRSETGRLLEAVKVEFVDTGLDQWRSTIPYRFPVGVTDSDGQLDQKLTYSWGYRIRGRPKPGRVHSTGLTDTFSLKFSAVGYETQFQEYRIAELPIVDNSVYVKFEVVMTEEY